MILFFECHGYDLFQSLLRELKPLQSKPVHKVTTSQASSKSCNEKYRLCFAQRLRKMPQLGTTDHNKQSSDRTASPTALVH